IGSARYCIEHSIAYAKQRKAFGKTISDFGLIREKLANMAVGIFTGESMAYRTVGMMDAAIATLGSHTTDMAEVRKIIDEYAIECSILKVWGSELINYVVDEMVQIYGGYGFVEEYPAERAYRDSRINRIFEGTNEINRLLTVEMTLKRAMQGRLNMMGPAMKVQQELMSIPDFGEEDETPFAQEKKLVNNFKKTILLTAGAAAQKLMMKLESEQEVLMCIADMVIDTFVAESLLLRVMKLSESDSNKQLYQDILSCYLYDAADRINKKGKDAVNAFAEGDEQRMILMGLKRFTKAQPFNSKDARRRISDFLIEQRAYTL
ncbi:MAG TPA: acyl-CoA dehydrogenase family protein, partial [Ferruginibacter sp.]|nr:acyl-CoA dehydrogenase family protein [Ferruginibacter sp.]